MADWIRGATEEELRAAHAFYAAPRLAPYYGGTCADILDELDRRRQGTIVRALSDIDITDEERAAISSAIRDARAYARSGLAREAANARADARLKELIAMGPPPGLKGSDDESAPRCAKCGGTLGEHADGRVFCSEFERRITV
ncbi:MAG TPA: hypothetical protein VJT85_00055 [Gemmatimonadaceae bacterium]|nr:hypothetical protein [Gemmatimonadaceae bacterium]